MKNKARKVIQIVMLLFIVSILTISCKKDDTTTTTTVPKTPTGLTIGQTYQGGKIAYILNQGDSGYSATVQHGIIAAPVNQTQETQNGGEVWANSFFDSGATATAIGTGLANTDILIQFGSSAALLCSELVLSDYSDWYLPSKDELNKLYINRYAIGNFTTYNSYWSSSEYDANSAWSMDFASGSQSHIVKQAPFNVRAVRSF